MLVLSRKTQQTIKFYTADGTIDVTVLRSGIGGAVRVGVDAPASVKVLRAEVADRDRVKSDATADVLSLQALDGNDLNGKSVGKDAKVLYLEGHGTGDGSPASVESLSGGVV